MTLMHFQGQEPLINRVKSTYWLNDLQQVALYISASSFLICNGNDNISQCCFCLAHSRHSQSISISHSMKINPPHLFSPYKKSVFKTVNIIPILEMRKLISERLVYLGSKWLNLDWS